MGDGDVKLENRVIVFMDVHNFSIAAQTLGDKSWRFLQEMYETLGEIVVAHGGEIAKYVGDGMLISFPTGAANDSVACARQLRATFSDLVARYALPSDTELEIGIAAGRVAIGTFGHQSLRQKDVFGETVLQAAVIGHHRGVAITEQVYERIKVNYKTRKLPAHTVKWQAEPLQVWEIIA